MKPRLVIGPLNYSSWSVRPWLALTHAKIEFSTHQIGLFVDPEWKRKVEQFSGAAKVPVLVHGSLSVHESLAICEYVAELAPDAGLWPQSMQVRARARAICSEMATSFDHLRSELPMNARGRAVNFEPSAGAKQNIARVFDIWSASLQTSGGPYLFGDFGIADCMYAPVVSRLHTYGIKLSEDAAQYAQAIAKVPAIKQWHALAQKDPPIAAYDAPLGLT